MCFSTLALKLDDYRVDLGGVSYLLKLFFANALGVALVSSGAENIGARNFAKELGLWISAIKIFLSI